MTTTGPLVHAGEPLGCRSTSFWSMQTRSMEAEEGSGSRITTTSTGTRVPMWRFVSSTPVGRSQSAAARCGRSYLKASMMRPHESSRRSLGSSRRLIRDADRLMTTAIDVPPKPGEVVRVRCRRYLVEDVEPAPAQGERENPLELSEGIHARSTD